MPAPRRRRRSARAGRAPFPASRIRSAPLDVERVEFLRDPQRASGLGEQAFDAEAHVGQAAGGAEARADAEAEVGRRRPPGESLPPPEQRSDARLQAAGAHALEALGDEDAVVAVELTTSAMVPSATRSSRSAKLGSAPRRKAAFRAARRARAS